MRADLPVLIAYATFACLVCVGLRAFALSKTTKLNIFSNQAKPGFRLPRRPLHVERGRTETVVLVLATVLATYLMTRWALSSWAVDAVLGHAGAAMELAGWRVAISYDGVPHVAGRLPLTALLLVLGAAGGAYALRDSPIFVFLAIHLAIAGLSLLADLLLDAPVPARDVVLQRALTTAFMLVLASHAFFAAIARPGLRGAVTMLASAVVSAVAFALGAVALVLIGTATTETTLMLVTYLIIAYGIVLQHVAGVALALSEGGPSAA